MLNKKKFTPQVKDEISNNLTILNIHQNQMKQQWDSLASPNKVFTILGLVQDFKYINKLLEFEQLQGNPSLLYGFQQVDEATMMHLRSILLLIRKHYLQTNVTEWINQVKPFINKA